MAAERQLAWAPKYTPRWLRVHPSSDEPGAEKNFVEIDTSGVDPSEFHSPWGKLETIDAYLANLSRERHAEHYYKRRLDRDREIFDAIQIRHKGSPVWWVDLDEGPREPATLDDLLLYEQPAWWPRPVSGAGKFGSDRPYYLMSLDQWDNAEWPPESQGGPPYTPHVSIARDHGGGLPPRPQPHHAASYDLEYGKYRDKPLAFLRGNEPDYSDAQYLIKRWPKTFAMVPYTAHSRQYDYGGPSNESNYRVWKRDFPETEGKTWWDLGDNGILARIDIAPKDQKEAIESLEGYPILDEDNWSELEREIQDENWKDYGLRDTRDDLVKRADASIVESVEHLFEVMPDQVFINAYWEERSVEGTYPEQDGGGYSTVFPSAFEDWDGKSFHDLVMWLGLSDSVIRVRLSDSAFGPWRPTAKPGEKERSLRITKEQLEQSAGDKLTKSQLARLMRNGELQIKFDEEFPCESLYVECIYPWGTEEEEQVEGASEMPRKNPIATAHASDAAEEAVLICMGRHVLFDIDERDSIELPARWGMLHDPDGVWWPSCSLLFAPFAQGADEDASGGGRNYFGRKAHVRRGCVEIPPHDIARGWREVGVVKQIFYERAGTKAPGRFRHRFNDPRGWMWLVALFKKRTSETPVVLFEYNHGDVAALRLELPDGCLVDERGIALP